MQFGLIADTHGYLGDDILEALAGCDHILHAGDVGEGVLERLVAIAPVTAVRGNTDRSGSPAQLPLVATVDSPAGPITVVHRLVDAPHDASPIVVFGHCHRRHAYRDADGRFYANPGAAGRRGFHANRSVAKLHLRPDGPAVEFIDLGPRKEAR